jgi:hypothetical protein
MLELVVQGGTGTQAAVTGYRGGQDRYRPQAAVRAPALPVRRAVRRICAGERPADTIVVLDEPSSAIFGGTVAAPAFSQIMQQALR